jgi:hypothetical protein
MTSALSRIKSASIHKWPCDGVPRFNVADAPAVGRVTYAVAYNIIFHAEGGKIEKGSIVYTRSAIRRLKLLNASYLIQAGKWVRSTVKNRLGLAVLSRALAQPEPEPETSDVIQTIPTAEPVRAEAGPIS